MVKPGLVIVSPALADSNNGNWQTAKRWSDLLDSHYSSRITKHWPDVEPMQDTSIMLALHACRSTDSIHAWAASKGKNCECPGLVVALTGTDLYRDIHTHPEAINSLHLAEHLIVLQDKAVEAVPERYRYKTHVVYQSTSAMPTITNKGPILKVLMVGHLREEKMPETYLQAAQILKDEAGIELEHVGEALDEKYIQWIKQTTASCPNYHWLGGLSYAQSRKKMQEAHVLVHCSKMEGGAHVIMEAVRSGTPVLASRIDGNVGMLGENYSGYFELGNAQQLARLLLQIRDELKVRNRTDMGVDLIRQLQRQADQRATLFTPQQEQESLLNILKLIKV